VLPPMPCPMLPWAFVLTCLSLMPVPTPKGKPPHPKVRWPQSRSDPKVSAWLLAGTLSHPKVEPRAVEPVLPEGSFQLRGAVALARRRLPEASVPVPPEGGACSVVSVHPKVNRAPLRST
jgi:hypothetical protein